MENDEILTLKEAANMLGISRGTLYNWRSSGAIRKDKRYKRIYILQILEQWTKGQLMI
jgi:predicted site-specific integrase-resolvase